jgi:hypothetical protein
MPSEKMKLIKWFLFHSVNRRCNILERKLDMSLLFHIKLLTVYSCVLLQKLIVPKLAENFPAFNAVRRFITSRVDKNQILVHIGLKNQMNQV